MKKIYPFALLPVLFACHTRINYMGTSFQPTTRVDVYVDAAAIKRSYTIVGKGYKEFNLSNKEKMQEKAIRLAREKGADAILFQDYFLTNDHTTAYSISNADSAGKALNFNPKNESSYVITSQINILFLKYN